MDIVAQIGIFWLFLFGSEVWRNQYLCYILKMDLSQKAENPNRIIE